MSESANVPGNDGPIYNTESKIPAGTLLLTIIQHFFALTVYMTYPVIISGAICSEEQLTSTLISVTLIGCGIATILQACRRLGSGQVLPIIPNSSYLPASLLAATGGGLPMLYGMLIVGGIFEIIISRLTHFFRYVFPLEICGTVLFLLGISIVPFAFPLFCGSTESFPLDPAATAVGILTLASMIILSVLRKRIFKFYSMLFGIVIGFITAVLLGVFNLDTLKEITTVPVFAVPEFAFLHGGYAFNPALLAPFIIAVICLVMKTTGNIEMLNRYTKSESKKSLRRGLFSEGIGLTLSGILGGIGTGTSSGGAGLVVSTGVAARKVGFGLGILLIICGFLPVIGWIFHLIPKPILGAVLIYAIVFVMMSGLTSITSRVLDPKRIFVVFVPILFGVSSAVCPYLYTNLPEWAAYFFASPLTVGSVTAVVLGLLLKIGIPHRKTLFITPSSDVSAFVMECAGLWTLDKLQGGSLGTELSKEIKENDDVAFLSLFLHGRETIEIEIGYHNGTVKHMSRLCL